MSQLTITSPGVQINEVDLSIISRPIGTTDVLITGFAPQGPTEELINVGSVSEFESVFGVPTNPAERYLYYTARQILSQSPANVLVSRIPYGANLGEGYGNSYSALVYPISSNAGKYADSTEFKLMSPVSILLSDDEYYNLVSNNVIWNDSPYQYALGDSTNTFGLLTNATSAVTQGQRIYGISTTPLSTLSQAQLDDLFAATYGVSGVVAPLTEAYGYVDALWDIVGTENTTTIYNKASADAGEITLNTVYNYVYSPSANSSFAAEYGDSTLVFETTAYSFDEGVFLNTIESAEDLLNGKGGLVLINTSKTSVNNLFEGYYVAVADNSNFNPSTSYDSIRSMKSVNGVVEDQQNFVDVPQSRLNFTLTQSSSAFTKDSLSRVIEQYPIGYDFATPSFKDSIVLMLFKIKSTQYNQDTIQLDYSVVEGYAGSFFSARTQNNQNGGSSISFFLDTVINNKSTNLKSIINPYVTTQGTWTNDNGTPAKSVRVDDSAKAAYATGVYTIQNSLDNKDLGRVDLKLSRFLDVLSNDDTTNIDVIADAGLSTIWATAYANKIESGEDAYRFDETYTPSDIENSGGIGNTNVNVVPSGVTLDAYRSITNRFVSYAEARKDHVFISDPLRQIFVRGENTKTSSKKNFIFSNQIYWPLNNIYNAIQSSYVTTYGNWIKNNDIYSSKAVWLPSSGYATAIIARSSQTTYPWIAPAGFNRGTLTNILDIAVNPTQKQRDLLYKINVNPIAYFNQDGFVIFGQKTLYRKPSAFDRINVRRLFLTLEKATQRLLKYYVFEPNDFATRNRLKGSLTPIFDQAKLNEGCYDYLIVCDTTNNTPDVIDNNELKISIYIQPVRAAEFILADFIATRTGVNFSELLAGGQS
jgi:phage tail sheath protein FI